MSKRNGKNGREGQKGRVIVTTTDKMPELDALQVRRRIARQALYIIDQEIDDPRRESAMDEYRRQLAEIDRRITEITGTPPPVVIGLKAANLTARKG